MPDEVVKSLLAGPCAEVFSEAVSKKKDTAAAAELFTKDKRGDGIYLTFF